MKYFFVSILFLSAFPAHSRQTISGPNCDLQVKKLSGHSEEILRQQGYRVFRADSSVTSGLWAQGYVKCFDSWEDVVCGDGGFEVLNDYCRSTVRIPRNIGEPPYCIAHVKILNRNRDRDYSLYSGKVTGVPECVIKK